MPTAATQAVSSDTGSKSDPPAEPARWVSPAEEADYLRQRIAATPEDESLYFRLATVCFKMANPWEAEYCYRHLTRINPKNLDAWRQFARLNGGEDTTATAALRRRELFARAIGLHDAGRFSEAHEAYLQTLAGSVNHSAAWNLQILELDQSADPPDQPRISIYVCCHKAGPAPQDEVHKPIHVGAALAASRIGHPGDDSGPNISAKNRSYCELTGHYWAWQNDRDSDFIGLAHYRRLFWFSHIQDPSISRHNRKAIPLNGPFGSVMRPEIARRMIASSDVIVPMRWRLGALDQQFVTTAPNGHKADYALLWNLMVEIANRNHPDIYQGGKAVVAAGDGHCYNMMVMRRPYFEEYSAFLFDVMERLEQCAAQIGISIFASRVAGFIAERLMSIYIGYLRTRQQARIREVPIAHFI